MSFCLETFFESMPAFFEIVGEVQGLGLVLWWWVAASVLMCGFLSKS